MTVHSILQSLPRYYFKGLTSEQDFCSTSAEKQSHHKLPYLHTSYIRYTSSYTPVTRIIKMRIVVGHRWNTFGTVGIFCKNKLSFKNGKIPFLKMGIEIVQCLFKIIDQFEKNQLSQPNLMSFRWPCHIYYIETREKKTHFGLVARIIHARCCSIHVHSFHG